MQKALYKNMKICIYFFIRFLTVTYCPMWAATVVMGTTATVYTTLVSCTYLLTYLLTIYLLTIYLLTTYLLLTYLLTTYLFTYFTNLL